MFNIETRTAVYKTKFFHAQINITSRCNMRCEHCRGAYEGAVDLSIDDFENLILFCNCHLAEGAGYLISGGEPLLHPQFRDILKLLKKYLRDDCFIAVTTNGSFLDSELLDYVETLEIPKFRISISLDSINSKRHNLFRHCSYAFERAIQAIKLVSGRPNIKCLVRATIQKDQLNEVEKIACLVDSLGADVLSVSSIIPVGRALNKPGMYFDKSSKKELVELPEKIMKKYPRLEVDINDPLFYINSCSTGNGCEYGGCIAGIGSFSVEPTGVMLPCPVLPNQIIMNICGKSPKQMMNEYSNSPIIHSLLDRNLTGKCGNCKLRFSCGGCRARAEGIYGSYLAEDPDCWI